MIDFHRVADPVVSLLIVGWRDAPLLAPCLRSVAAEIGDVPVEVMIALNEPTARLVAEVDAEVSGATVRRFRANLGFGGAVNHLAGVARGEFLALLNDDCVVEPGWLASLVETARRRPRCGLVGSKFLNFDGTLQEAGSVLWADGSTWAIGDGLEDGHLDFERQVDYCSGGSLLVRRQLWNQLGGLDDRYYPAYYEDVDLSLRAARAGWSSWYQPASRVRHVRSASTTGTHRSFIAARTGRAFAERWAAALAERAPVGDVELALWIARGRPLRVLVIDDRMPDRSIGSGFGRMWDTLEVLGSDPGLAVSFHPVDGAVEPPAEFARLGIRTVPDLCDHLSVDGVGYDVVVVSRPHNAARVLPALERLLPHARVVYDAEALYHRRLEAQAWLAGTDSDRDALLARAHEMRLTEEDVLRRSDAVVCISTDEAERSRHRTSATVEVVEPWMAGARPGPADFSERSELGLVAGWLGGPGAPNSDALLWFARHVLPLVRAQLSSCTLLVTGASPPADVSWLAGPSVRFVGKVPELSEFYNGIRVAISPARFGAGVKLKTVEAVQYGVPVVSTAEAAAGLRPALRSALTVADDPRHFADAIISLMTDRQAWQRCRAGQLAQVGADPVGSGGVGRWPAILRDTVAAPNRKVLR